MKKIVLLFLLLQMFTLQAEELFWFDIDCNLRGADYIVRGEILDDKGRIKITHDYSYAKIEQQEIILTKFGSAENFSIDPFYESLQERSVILFLKSTGTEGQFEPAWLQWEISTLWVEGEVLKSVIQPENPGGWVLTVYYEEIIALEVKIDNWNTLKKVFWDYKKYEDRASQLKYLSAVFKWHPFKYEIAREFNKDKTTAREYLERAMGNLSRQRLPVKDDICKCIYYRRENVYAELFSGYKEATGADYQKLNKRWLQSVKGALDKPQNKRSGEVNENFITEFLIFLNANPPADWADEKEALRKTVEANSEFYTASFLRNLRARLQ